MYARWEIVGYDNKDRFYQWDTGQKLIVWSEYDEIHFSQEGSEEIVCQSREENGKRVVDVPNILLQKAKPITVYGILQKGEGIETAGAKSFKVIARQKPANYVYNVTEVLNFSTLAARLEKLEREGQTMNSMANTPYYGAKISATGDSATSATGVKTIGGYVKMIANKYNMEYENIAVGGATVASGIIDENGRKRFSICDSIGNMSNDADIIILSGGGNDAYMINRNLEVLGELTEDFTSELNKATLYGGLEFMLRQAIYKWANKTILYVTTHKIRKNNIHIEPILQTCKKYGIPIVSIEDTTPNIYYLQEFKEKYTLDGVHPTEDCYATFYFPAVERAVRDHFRGKGETESIVDSSMPNVICINPAITVEEEYNPTIAGFIRENGTISTSDNYLRTDYIDLTGKTKVEYRSFVVKTSSMATWAVFDADKNWLVSSGDINKDDYFVTDKNGTVKQCGYKSGEVDLSDVRSSYPGAKYIVLSTSVTKLADFDIIEDENGNNVGWSGQTPYITLI